MPLPDERPRQSVANLIGRFEKQKSTSGPAPPPPTFPRTSSVLSQRSGDTAQEEIKEKREWPPRKTESSAATLSPPDPGPGKPPFPPSSIPAVDKEATLSSEPSLPSPPPEAKSLSTPPPSVEPIQPMPPKVKSPAPPQSKSISTRTTSVKSSTPKSTVKPSTAAPAKPPVSAGSVNSTPLKPQHTGQSVTSTGPGTKHASTRNPATPKTHAAVTPARVKTPLSNARPKTPLSHARPRTPSTGLYAPTAASLARSRAHVPTPPAVEKAKRRVTTDLSKPTAASASKVRSPAPTPTRGGKTATSNPVTPRAVAKSASKAAIPARPIGTSKVTGVKPAVGQSKTAGAKSSALAPVTSEGPTIAQPVAEAAAKPITSSTEEAHSPTESEIPVDTHPEDFSHELDVQEEGSTEEALHHDEAFGHGDQGEVIENYDDDFVEESYAVHEQLDEPQNEEVEKVADSSPMDHQGGEDITITQHVELQPGDEYHDQTDHDTESLHSNPSKSVDTASDLHHAEDVVESDHSEHVDNHATTIAEEKPQAVGNDLEDIVNLLESGPKVQRPTAEPAHESISVPITAEIPDEE